MRNKIIVFTIAGLLVCLGIVLPTAQAQDKCTLATMTGTYAVWERGSSTYADVTGKALSPPPTPPFWNETTAPFATVGEVTFGPDGVGQGFFWMWAGLLAATVDPIHAKVTITEMNPDCTGKFSYTLPGSNPPTTVVERFIAFDDGREFRSVPATLDNGVPGLAWIGEGHRISRSDEPPKSCGPQTAQGTYVTTVTNLINFLGDTGFADAIIVRSKVSITGDFIGTMYEKLGLFSFPIEDAVYGTIKVNPDCSFSEVLNIPSIGASLPIRGVFFNEGKEYYGMAVKNPPAPSAMMYSIGQGKRVDNDHDE